MPTIHLIEGPVGSGKSTFAARLAMERAAVHIALDRWFATLFSPDRPDGNFVQWYVERKERCIDVIWNVAVSLLATGTDAVLELGLIQRDAREAFYRRADAEGCSLSVHVIDAPREIRRERVRQRNENRGATFSMVVPDHIFDLANRMWEPPDEDERMERQIEIVQPSLLHGSA